MITIVEALKGINAYPIPNKTISQVSVNRGLNIDANVCPSILQGEIYNLVVADLLVWLSNAPNITQGGQSYSFTDAQRQEFIRRASKLYDKYGRGDDEDNKQTQVVYGYKGSML